MTARPSEDGSASCVHGLFREQVRLRPDAVAVSRAERTVTYRQLDAWSDHVAARLAAAGVRPGDAVTVDAVRSLGYPAAVLGVLKAGAAYVPLDPAYPAARRELIVRDSGATAMLGGDPAPRDEVGLPYVALPAQTDTPQDTSAQPDFDGGRAAYVVFTSGSTGRPKGVVVEHRQVVALVVNDERLHVRPGERVALFAPPAFDASTFELWNTLCRGGELVVLERGWDSVADLAEQLRRARLDWMFLTSGFFHLLVEHEPSAVDHVGRLITGGDLLSPRLVSAAARRRTARVYAAYGPTETTTFASLHEVDPEREYANIPIGSPLRGASMHVFDDSRRPAPTGEVGELYLGGAGVARGYLGRAELTAERFLDELPGAPGRLYRTGDLVRRLPDGEYEFVGRTDRQVKIRGFRVEPGEIETCLATHPAVGGVAVEAVADAAGAKRLAAYVVAAEGAEPDPQQLRRWLAVRLPPHLEPSVFVLLDALPLGANGKTDRARLPYPWARRTQVPGLTAYRAPSSALEALLAEVWADALAVDEVGADDDFYQLGGDSLRSVAVMARLRGRGLSISARDFFRNPTVRRLAAVLEAAGEQIQEEQRHDRRLIERS